MSKAVDETELTEELQTKRDRMSFSCRGAKMVLDLKDSLENKLQSRLWEVPGRDDMPKKLKGSTMLDFYRKYWKDWGDLLVEMENTGVPVDRGVLDELITEARKRRTELEGAFRTWVKERLEHVYGTTAIE